MMCLGQVINLAGNRLGAQTADALGSMLAQSHCRLRLLTLSNAFPAWDSAVTQGALANGIKKALCLTHLNLDGSLRMGDAGAAAIAAAMMTQPSVTLLSLSGCGIGNMGALSLGAMLTSNGFLKTLLVRQNRIGNIGAEALARGLEGNTGLTCLDMSRNFIKTGVAMIALALAKTKHLTYLNIEDNKIGPEGAIALAKGLEVNKSLRVVSPRCAET